jgi:tetratricopeptide (TPR) repeat protein
MARTERNAIAIMKRAFARTYTVWSYRENDRRTMLNEQLLLSRPLGRARYRLFEYAEAEQAFTRAALLDKDFEAAELMLLHAYVRQGKLSAALSGIDALLKKSPGSSPNRALEKFRSEVVGAMANSKQGEEKQE